MVNLDKYKKSKEATLFLKEAIEILSNCDKDVFSHDTKKLKLIKVEDNE